MIHFNCKLKNILVGLWFLALLLSSACQNTVGAGEPAVTPTPIPTLGPVTLNPIGKWDPNLVLFDDMPGNWHVGGRTIDQEFDTDSYYYWYFNPELPQESKAVISERFAVYPTVESAQEHFIDWQDRIIPPAYADSWKQISTLRFSYHADEIRIACMSDSENSQPFWGCAMIARYRNVIVVVRGNVYESKWFTIDDYRTVLEAADRRIALVLSGGTP